MEYTLEIAILAPSIREQLNSQGVYMKLDNYEKYEKIRRSIHMVRMHGMFTESEIERAWKRFYKKIQKDIYDDIKIESM